MAPEDVFDLGNPDETLASAWVPLEDIQTLNGNGYNFVRPRMTFFLGDDQKVDDPLPSLGLVRLDFLF